MTESWVPIPAAAWPDIADAMTKPWPRWAVRFDLRWWADRERMGRAKRPGRPTLCKRWGWGDKAARNVMAAVGEWADPRHGDPNPDKGKVREIPQGPAGVQPWSSEGPAGVQDSDDKCAESLGAGSSEGPAGVQQWSSKGPHARDTQAQTQAQDTGTEEQEDNPAADASESGKPDDPIRALWDKWEPKRVEVYGGRVGKLTKARRSAMRARIKDHSVEEVATVIAWWLTSSHDRAAFLRANGCTWDTVLRPTKFPGYLEMAGQAAQARQQRTLPTGSDQTERTALEAIAKMRALYADHGSLPYDKMPPAIVGALREIGGIRYLFGAVNDFQQRDRTNAFVAAYRRHAAGTENG